MSYWLALFLLTLGLLGGSQGAQSQVSDVVRQKSQAAAKEYIRSGNILAGEAKYEAAAQEYRKAISLDPNSAEAYSLMGSALAEAGKVKEAEEALRKAVAIKPDYAEGYYHLGLFLQSQKREAEAQEAFRKAKQYRR
jgi:Tfp pilus assembly protein PilF